VQRSLNNFRSCEELSRSWKNNTTRNAGSHKWCCDGQTIATFHLATFHRCSNAWLVVLHQ